MNSESPEAPVLADASGYIAASPRYIITKLISRPICPPVCPADCSPVTKFDRHETTNETFWPMGRRQANGTRFDQPERASARFSMFLLNRTLARSG
jgi:hypothetical protein